MPKRRAKQGKASSPHDDYELPDEVNFAKTKFIGLGLDALERHVAGGQKTTVELDPDVAQVFTDSKAVNNVLRAFIANARMPTRSAGKGKKSA